MRSVAINNSFAEWRYSARNLLAQGIAPSDVVWTSREQNSLFANKPIASGGPDTVVPAEFIRLSEAVACFDDDQKWPLLYRLLFRLTNENRHLLAIESDPDVARARAMRKAVDRDVHKFHAFVRFRRVACENGEHFVAWHDPQHWTVERSVPFFVRRFGAMRFSILTPKGCAHWDKEELVFSAAASRACALAGDDMEDFWLLYYRSIFNPFRLKLNAMKKEMPMHHWTTLPEAVLIPELIRQSSVSVAEDTQ